MGPKKLWQLLKLMKLTSTTRTSGSIPEAAGTSIQSWQEAYENARKTILESGWNLGDHQSLKARAATGILADVLSIFHHCTVH
jgi:hypothetical protein